LSKKLVEKGSPGCRKCGNGEGASQEIVHAHGKLISCKSSKIK